MAYINRNFTWDFDALKRFYEKYIVKWLNSAVSWTEAQKKQARANLGFGDGDIDNEPTVGSDNTVKSGGIYEGIKKQCIITNKGYYLDKGHYVNVSSPVSYVKQDGWNCLWIPINSTNIKRIVIDGKVESDWIRFFSSYEFSDDSFVGSSKVGNVPSGSVLCIYNYTKASFPENYDSFVVSYEYDFATEETLQNEVEARKAGDNHIKDNIYSVLNDYTIPIKNLINFSDLLYGKSIKQGNYVDDDQGIMSNKIVFDEDKTYAFQGIGVYSSAHYLLIGYFDANDNYLGRKYYRATLQEEGVLRGNYIIKFTSSSFTGYNYCRVVLQMTGTATLDETKAQIELGDNYTQVVGYKEVVKFEVPPSSPRKCVRLLSIGNSYSQDMFSYVPFILKNISNEIDVEIGILYASGAPLSEHVTNFNEEHYTFYYFLNGDEWTKPNGDNNVSISWALQNYTWDIVTLQQSSSDAFQWNTYQPYLNQLINKIYEVIDYPLKIGWVQVQSKPASSAASGNFYGESTITEHYESICDNTENVMNQTVCSFLIPVGTAIQNSRTIASIKVLGNYANHANNTSGLGYLTVDGVHLQDGLPCQIAAYTITEILLKLYGFEYLSVYGDTIRVTDEWIENKLIPGKQGNCIGSTDENCLIAQQCAIMAVKHPYEATDMNYIINPT